MSTFNMPCRRLVVVIALTVPGVTALAADPYAGAQVSGSARYYSLICGTCPIDSAVVGTAADGGTGAAQATIGEASPGWSFVAVAAIDPAGGLPQLGGAATAEIIVDHSVPKTFFYKSFTFSQALQRYDYSGSTPMTYALDFTLSGDYTLVGLGDAASLMLAHGGYTVYGANYDPVGEFRGTVLDTEFVSSRPSLPGTHDFAVGGSLSFTVNPGDHFYIWGALDITADSGHGIAGGVDAMHTLAARFTQGDLTLLQASVTAAQPVPEPSTCALLLAGLAGVAWRRRSALIRGAGV